jgi:flagellar basal-body rod modification protein FlgD
MSTTISAYPTTPSNAEQLGSATSTTTGSSELNQDTFLKLLTTQLQNQDPTNPVSNEDFIAQLAQFSSLEQLQGVNSSLSNLTTIDTSMNNASMVSLLGQDVVAASDTFHYSGSGSQDILYNSSSGISGGTLTIKDANGSIVSTVDLGSQEEGEHSLSWDGKGLDGQPLPAGNYTASYSATDANGNSVSITPLMEGVVDQLSFANGTPQPTVDGVPVDIGNIIRLSTKKS